MRAQPLTCRGMQNHLIITPVRPGEDAEVDRTLSDPRSLVGGRETNGIVFLTSLPDAACIEAIGTLGGAQCTVVRDLTALRLATKSGARTLVSFGTSVIVPRDLLETLEGRAYNIHGASPHYPGRDPHNWATYDAVTRYGATLHIMTARVDEGPILDVEWFDVKPGTKPGALLAMANAAGMRLLQRAGPAIQRGDTLAPSTDVAWHGRKRSRADFHAMCRLSPDVSAEEFRRRYHAFDGEAYANLVVTMHGHTFRIEKA